MKTGTTNIFGGSMMIAGVAIGAGMLALPIISSGMWFYWSLVLLLATWFLTYLSANAILEVNLAYEPGTTLASMVQDILGTKWNIINIISLLFALYMILYAYISGGTSAITQVMRSAYGIELPRIMVGVVFTLFFAGIIYFSSKAVDRASSILFIVLCVSFFLAMYGLSGNFSVKNFAIPDGSKTYLFIWIAVSTYTTSFCFHPSVSSLVKYFGNGQIKNIQKSILYGSLIALVCYVLWISIIYGVIPREAFRSIIAQGGNIGELIRATQEGTSSVFILQCLGVFAFLALTTSLLGVGLGLFDYISDLLKIPNTRTGRFLTILITFAPPMLSYLFFPNGFLSAISWAGVFVMVWTLLIPAVLVLRFRKYKRYSPYRCYKSNFWSYLLIAYAFIAAACHILAHYNILPTF